MESLSSKIARLATIALVLIFATDLPVAAQPPVGVVTRESGQVGVQRGANQLQPAVGTQLDQGDRVTTGADGHVAMTLSDQSELELAESSIFVLDQQVMGSGGRISTSLSLLLGGVQSVVTSAAGGVPNFAIHTPNAVVAVRGTRFNTSYHEGTSRPGYPSCKHFTDVQVFEGTVDVGSATNPSAPHVDVTSGYETTVACDAPPLEPGPLGVTGAGGIGSFRGLAPGPNGAPPPSEPPPPPPPPPRPPPDT